MHFFALPGGCQMFIAFGRSSYIARIFPAMKRIAREGIRR